MPKKSPLRKQIIMGRVDVHRALGHSPKNGEFGDQSSTIRWTDRLSILIVINRESNSVILLANTFCRTLRYQLIYQTTNYIQKNMHFNVVVPFRNNLSFMHLLRSGKQHIMPILPCKLTAITVGVFSDLCIRDTQDEFYAVSDTRGAFISGAKIRCP